MGRPKGSKNRKKLLPNTEQDITIDDSEESDEEVIVSTEEAPVVSAKSLLKTEKRKPAPVSRTKQDVPEGKVKMLSQYPELNLTISPQKKDIVKVDGKYRELVTETRKGVRFNKFSAFVDKEDVEGIQNSARYGIDFMTLDDFHKLLKENRRGAQAWMRRLAMRYQIFVGSEYSESGRDAFFDELLDLI